MQIEWNTIDAVILDLGGVILNIDYRRSIDAFKRLGFHGFEEQYSQMQQSGLFDRLETGKISEAEFVRHLQQMVPHTAYGQIVEAWNALLLDFPEGRIATVKAIAATFPTYLLSNTNAIHLRSFNATLRQQTGLSDIKPLFKKAYLSHELGLRKPDREIFEYIIADQGLDPESTLFIDDSPQHLVGARNLGIQTYHMTEDDSLEALFAPVLA